MEKIERLYIITVEKTVKAEARFDLKADSLQEANRIALDLAKDHEFIGQTTEYHIVRYSVSE